MVVVLVGPGAGWDELAMNVEPVNDDGRIPVSVGPMIAEPMLVTDGGDGPGTGTVEYGPGM